MTQLRASINEPSFVFWLGMNDIASEGTFVNSDGSAMTYGGGWACNQPDNFGAGEDCTIMLDRTGNSEWNDVPCGMQLGSLCERTCLAMPTPCVSSPCQNGATCAEIVGELACLCGDGYTGATCDTALGPPCASSPCQNGGVCSERTANTFSCACTGIWAGETCDSSSIVCESNPCQNGGTCTATFLTSTTEAKRYTCTCPSGWTGIHCDTVLCPSDWQPYGGSCYHLSTGNTLTWNAAEAYCQSSFSGAHLVVVSSAAENIYLASVSTKPFWIGLHDKTNENRWEWVVGGTIMPYENFACGEVRVLRDDKVSK